MRITLTLREDEQHALVAVSKADRRHPRQQAAVLIRESLAQRGLLQNEPCHTAVPTHTAVPQGVNDDAQ
ncbi:MAG: hypothetical protein KF770_13365 [Anaerolineae bacterium]|nr:hypothetical protein [Anaerolineae bacterium]